MCMKTNGMSNNYDCLLTACAFRCCLAEVVLASLCSFYNVQVFYNLNQVNTPMQQQTIVFTRIIDTGLKYLIK